MELHDIAIILKLVNGDTIVTCVLSDTDKNLLVRDPMIMRTTRENTPEGVLVSQYCTDWFPSAESRIHLIRKDHVLSAAIPNDELKIEFSNIVEDKDQINPDTKTLIKKKKKKVSSPTAEDGLDWDLNFKFPDKFDGSRN